MANDRFEMTPHAAFETPLAVGAERVTAFLRKVYGWMFAGLAITATVAFLVSGTPALLQIVFGNPIVFFGLIAVELGLVFFLSARVDKMAPQTAATLFVVAVFTDSSRGLTYGIGIAFCCALGFGFYSLLHGGPLRALMRKGDRALIAGAGSEFLERFSLEPQKE